MYFVATWTEREDEHEALLPAFLHLFGRGASLSGVCARFWVSWLLMLTRPPALFCKLTEFLKVSSLKVNIAASALLVSILI